MDLTEGFDRSGESAALAADRRVRGNLVALTGWAGTAAGTAEVRELRMRFWLRPVEIEASASGTVAGLRLERTRITAGGAFEGTGEFETLDAQMVMRSVGYQSVPLPGVPFDERTHTIPNVSGRVLAASGQPLPGEYVAGWLKRGPTGVIGTNKSDAAQTVRSLLADLAGGPGPDDVQLPRPGLLRLPKTEPVAAATAGEAEAAGEPGAAGPVPAATGSERFAALLAERGITPIGYADWLKIETAEKDLAAALGRGARVKLASRADIHAACGLRKS
jgi:ferredoxin--NADP+ reductase